MNEGIRIQILVDGVAATPVRLAPNGVEFAAEPGLGRGLTFSVRPANHVTEFRLRRVRAIQDWHPGQFHVRFDVDGGGFLCQGVDAASLPEGIYEVGLEVSDLTARSQPVKVTVPFGGIANVTLQFDSDPRRVRLTTRVSEFDNAIRAVVDAPQSIADGLSLAQWLDNANTLPRPRRKACMLNLLAKLRGAPGVAAKTHLIDHVQSTFWGDVDRVYARVSPQLLTDLQTLSADPKKPFYFEGKPKAPIHRALLNRVNEPDASLYHLLSFRQEGKLTLQLVIAVPPGGDGSRQYYADLDIDLGNPLQDLEGLMIHFGELIAPGKTDHLKLAEKLYRPGNGLFDYSYYDVVSV